MGWLELELQGLQGLPGDRIQKRALSGAVLGRPRERLGPTPDCSGGSCFISALPTIFPELLFLTLTYPPALSPGSFGSYQLSIYSTKLQSFLDTLYREHQFCVMKIWSKVPGSIHKLHRQASSSGNFSHAGRQTCQVSRVIKSGR